jgi:hypothetical protein
MTRSDCHTLSCFCTLAAVPFLCGDPMFPAKACRKVVSPEYRWRYSLYSGSPLYFSQSSLHKTIFSTRCVSILQPTIPFRSPLYNSPDSFPRAFSPIVHHSRITPFAAGSGLVNLPVQSLPILRSVCYHTVVSSLAGHVKELTLTSWHKQRAQSNFNYHI